ncbi:MAG: ABC transporter ATP-binding protein, partial [Clostridia bacterium]|nr:ABC transporter ATP-binding protein [Clostridia bacterium]
DSGSLLVGMACRGNMPGACDIYLFSDSHTLCLLEGVTEVSSQAHRLDTPASLYPKFSETHFEVFAYDDIEEFEIEELVSGARLSIREKSGAQKMVCETPNTFKESLMLFAAYTRLAISGEFNGVEEEDKELRCPGCGRRYPDKNKVCPYCSDNTGILKKLLPFFKRYAGETLLLFLMLGVTGALGVLSPYISNSFYIDNVLTEGGRFYGQIMLVIGIILSVRVADLIISIINNIVTAHVAANITYDLKKTIFAAINRLSLGFFNSRRTGGLMTQIESDSSTLYQFFGTMVPDLTVAVIKVVAVAAVLFMMDPVLAFITLITVPFYVFMITRAFSKSRRMANLHYNKVKALTERLSDVMNGLRVVKAFAHERDESKHFHRLSSEKTGVYFEWSMYDVIVYPAISFVLYLGTVSVWAVGGMAVFRGEMSYGDLLTFVAYMGMVYSPLNYIINSIKRMSESINAASRLFEIAEAIPEVEESRSPVILDDIKGEVEFRDVSFAYTKSKKTIDRVSFKIEAGSTLGIVGRTGAGKSTIVNLLIRLYDVSDGEILIDGVNVKDMSFEQLRNSVAIVSQETYLFTGTIFE